MLNYRDQQWHLESVPLERIAEEFGTPCYVYSRSVLESNFLAWQQALGDHPHSICYAVKANSNIAVLNVLAKLGAGFDIVSIGELQRVLAAGGAPEKVVFSGVGKSAAEISQALDAGIACFNIESAQEAERINDVATGKGCVARISLRVNPDVDANTHPYIATGLRDNKFGVAMDDALPLYRHMRLLPGLEIVGVDCHIGSQLTSTEPFVEALQRVLELVDQLAEEGIAIAHLDLGGGLGVAYRDETPPAVSEYIAALKSALGERPLTLLFEPGRSIAAEAGILLMRVEYLKHSQHRNFAIVDAAMNDMLRPALYQAWMAVLPVRPRQGEEQEYDIVGPVCETGDFLAKERALCIEQGDLLMQTFAGAYGFSMSSNYNSRNRAAEIMVDRDQTHTIRARETFEHQIAGEALLP